MRATGPLCASSPAGFVPCYLFLPLTRGLLFNMARGWCTAALVQDAWIMVPGPSRTQRMRRWLRPGGALLPDFATLFVAAADASAVDLGFWERVYGFSYAPVAAELHEAAQAGPAGTPDSPAWSTAYSCQWPARLAALTALQTRH